MTEKKKNKPDYTKFMKKPAPLEPIESPAIEPVDSEPEFSPEDEIPVAEILSSDEQNGPEEGSDIRYFEAVSTENHLESEQSLKQTPAPQPIPEPTFVRDKRARVTPGKSVSSDSSRKTHITESAKAIDAPTQQVSAFQPPPMPVFIAPILLALMFLAF